MQDNRNAFTRIALVASALLLVASSFAASHHAPSKPQVKPAKVHSVSYMPDGTPIATGAPRRLSPLAGNDRIAWAYARGARRAKHAAKFTTQ